MIKVKIHFTGLCAFIPKLAIDQPNNEATVALVDASQSHHSHYCICFARENVYPRVLSGGVPNRRVDLAFNYQDDPMASPFFVQGCRFDKEQLTLVGRTATEAEIPLSNDALSFENGTRGNCAATTTEARFFNWVASMGTVAAGKVNKTKVIDDPAGGGLLGMRMQLTAGSLRSSAFRLRRPNEVVRWQFGGDNSALAEEVAWEVDINDPSVVEVLLTSKTLEASPQTRDAVVLKPAGMANVVEAWIVNMPLGDLTGFDPINPLLPNHHFAEYFRLADGSPTPVIPTPDPGLTQFCTPPAGAANPKCPPAVFDPPA